MRFSALGPLLAAALVLSACNNSNSSGAAPTAPPASGEFTGSMTDSVFGKGTADLTLTQTVSSLGGSITETFGSKALSGSASIAIDFNGNLTGSVVTDAGPSQSACGYYMTGTYDQSSGNLSGQYSAYSGCNSETGTFALTQQCTNPLVPGAARRRHAQGAHGILPC
jgi:hypothetical protein